MTWRNDPDVVRAVLTASRTWAVVGLRDNRARAAYGIAGYLQRSLGKRIVPVHPAAEAVHGERGYASLADVPEGTSVDVVDVFVRSELAGQVVDDAIAERERLGIHAVWLQLGVLDEAAAARARAAGLDVVMDDCPRIAAPALGLTGS